MGHYRRFFALFVFACFLNSAIVSYAAETELVTQPDSSSGSDLAGSDPEVYSPVEEEKPALELPVEDTSGGEVVVEDGSNIYHIEAGTIIIQPLPSDELPAEEVPEDSEVLEGSDLEGEEPLSEVDLEQAPILEDVPDIMLYALGSDGFPFYGSCWVSGSTPDLGSVTLFFPVNYKDGYIGLDSSGRLFNVSNISWTGVLYVDNSGTGYTVNFGAWGLPTYRRYSGSSYTNVTLYLTPEDGNILLPDGPSPTYSISDLLPYLSVLLLGGVFICCMRKS